MSFCTKSYNIYHIVGANCYSKQELIIFLTSLHIKFYDLDLITHKINSNKILEKCYKIKNKKVRAMAYQKVAYFWKKNFKKAIDIILQNLIQSNDGQDNKPIVLLGLNIYARNRNICVDIPNSHKIFLNINSKEYTKQTIKYNINKHMQVLIEGKFQLKYIDHDFILRQHNIIKEIYKQKKYLFMSLDKIKTYLQPQKQQLLPVQQDRKKINKKGEPSTICNKKQAYNKKSEVSNKIINTSDISFTNTNMNTISYTDNILYIVSTTRYEDIINKIDTDVAIMLDQENVYGYPEKWMALITASKILSRDDIKLNIDCIEELSYRALDKLKTCGYIYTANSYSFKKNGMRYKSTDDITILKREYVSNILNELIKTKIKIIRKK